MRSVQLADDRQKHLSADVQLSLKVAARDTDPYFSLLVKGRKTGLC